MNRWRNRGFFAGQWVDISCHSFGNIAGYRNGAAEYLVFKTEIFAVLEGFHDIDGNIKGMLPKPEFLIIHYLCWVVRGYCSLGDGF